VINMSISVQHRPPVVVLGASIENLPVSLFGAVMGLSGLSLAWRLASRLFGASTMIADAIGIVAIVVFIALALGYIAKLARYPSAVKSEFHHPVAGNFFGTIAIAILLLSTVVARYSAWLQAAVWTVGTILTIALSFLMITRLFKGNVDGGNAVPAWLIPGVATLDIAVAGAQFPLPWVREINLFAASVGAVFALVLLTMIVARLVHKEPLASQMVPSMMILIAPFEVGFLAYVNIMQRVDMFAALLFYVGLYLFILLARMMFRRSIAFGPGWWAVSFPMAALSSAALRYAAARDVVALDCLAGALLAIVTVTILVLLARTLHALIRPRPSLS
jgi:tellurite resistance protein